MFTMSRMWSSVKATILKRFYFFFGRREVVNRYRIVFKKEKRKEESVS